MSVLQVIVLQLLSLSGPDACVARDAFALHIDAGSVSADTRAKLTSHLDVGMRSRGFELCPAAVGLASFIRIDDAEASGVRVTVRYADVERARVVDMGQADSDDTRTLMLSIAIEELVLATAGPRALPPRPLPPDTGYHLGVELIGTTFADMSLGFGAGARGEWHLSDRIGAGAGLSYRRASSDTLAEGRTRYEWLDVDVGAVLSLWRTETLRLAINPSIAPLVVVGHGDAADGFAANHAVRMALIARLALEARVTTAERHAFFVRVVGGRPLAAVRGTTETADMGGIATWEATVAIGWFLHLP